MRVAFLGLGRMGTLMAGHVLSAGHDLVVWNRTPGRASELVARGAREAETPAEAVLGAERVVLMLFGPDSVRSSGAEEHEHDALGAEHGLGGGLGLARAAGDELGGPARGAVPHPRS